MSEKEATIQKIQIRQWSLGQPLIPKSWTEAAGLLRSKKKALEAHVKKVRGEWNTR
ncbi:MAG: hypothetical protein WC846_03560 [Candidatus Gracilibacteria bacterium]|jgi:hypothetical protein